MKTAPFDDIYFSAEDGLAETRHVFLEGNNLPEAWKNRADFTICETGFGTGLNFLAAWMLFEKSSRPGQRLHYISFEKHPLAWDDISRMLTRWKPEFGGRMDRLRELYPLRVPGFHRLMLAENVFLTLVFDDVNDAMPGLVAPGGVDAWFLDGFAPAKNPDMWSEKLFAEMARLSRSGATFATFTVAGAVRRGLETAGFAVEKKKGFGRKKEMLGGSFSGKGISADKKSFKKIAVLGGGLAGTAASFVLKRHGFQPVLFEKAESLATAGSGNNLGLFNPRLSAHRTAEADFYMTAFAQTVRTLGELQHNFDIQLDPCGSLHLIMDEDRRKRFSAMVENWGWHKSHMHLLDKAAASQRAGVTLGANALCLPDSGTVNPAGLCRAYTDGVDVRFGAPPAVRDLRAEYDAVVIACGTGVKEIAQVKDIPLHTVRGQITHFIASATTFGLRMNLCFGGYLSPQRRGGHVLGATFQRWSEDCDVKDEDHELNIQRLHDVFPGLEVPQVTGGRAHLRVSSRDRFPVIGMVEEGLYVSAAHGSHGIISSLAGAHLLADFLTGSPRSQSREVETRLSPHRFS